MHRLILTALVLASCKDMHTAPPIAEADGRLIDAADAFDARHPDGALTPSDATAPVDAPLLDGGGPGAGPDAAVLLDAAVMADAAPPPPPSLQKLGRWQRDTAWFPGATVVARFWGTSAEAVLIDVPRSYSNWLDITIDGVQQPGPLQLAPGRNAVVLAADLRLGEHVVEVRKRHEASANALTVEAMTFPGGHLLAPPPPKPLLVVVGDSNSAGFGSIGTMPCGFAADTSSQSIAWPSVLASRLGAAVDAVAFSGTGVTRMYGNQDSVDLIAPNLIKRLNPYDSGAAYHTEQVATTVVVMLGQNDFAENPSPPSDGEFAEAYRNLLAALRAQHPSAKLVAVLPLTVTGAIREQIDRNVATAIAARRAAGDNLVDYFRPPPGTAAETSGCFFHLSRSGHARLAAELFDHIVR